KKRCQEAQVDIDRDHDTVAVLNVTGTCRSAPLWYIGSVLGKTAPIRATANLSGGGHRRIATVIIDDGNIAGGYPGEPSQSDYGCTDCSAIQILLRRGEA